ncbi:MAG: hypothetical protein KIT00_12565 [Rhodospirillales bacterium]|nr:hypothetical protein [Rhodospirillales bacterium]
MADQIIAPLALLLFLIFLGFLAIYIGELDLWIIILLVAMLAATDFANSVRDSMNRTANNGNGGNSGKQTPNA